MRGDPAFGVDEAVRPAQPKRFQFSLGTLLGAVVYAGLLATLTVNFAGKEWSDLQVAAAYFVTIALVVGFAVMSKARGKIAAYVLLAPLIFVTAVSVASVLGRPLWAPVKPVVTTPAPTGTAVPPPLPPIPPPKQRTPIGP